MAKDRIVYKDGNQWVDKGIGNQRAGGRYRTQGEAIKVSRQRIQSQGGGELTVKGVDGKIRSKDTIAPGNDPCPPRDKEH